MSEAFDLTDYVCMIGMIIHAPLVVVDLAGLGKHATGVTAASVCNLGSLAWHDMSACIDELYYFELKGAS